MRCSPIFMRTIERTTAFRRDFKREAKGPRRNVLDTDLRRIIEALATDAPLEARHRDHALTGNWKDYRDCHVTPDLVLIYRLIEDDRMKIGRASCRERGCQYVSVEVVAVSLKKNTKTTAIQKEHD